MLAAGEVGDPGERPCRLVVARAAAASRRALVERVADIRLALPKKCWLFR